MLILSEADVAGLLSMRDAIDAVRSALIANARGDAPFPLRTMVRNPLGVLGAMPGAINGAGAALGAKLVSVFSGNRAHGEHSHQAIIVLVSPENGRPLALMDGRYITEIRTPAASAVATMALAVSNPTIAAIIGTGVQGRAHIEALATIESIREIRVWGRDIDKARALTRGDSGAAAVTASSTVEDACRGAQVICTVTASNAPVLSKAHLAPGTHVNAVGSCTPNARELSADLVAAARLFCDSRDGAMNEAGDILLAIKDGAIANVVSVDLLGDVLAGKAKGRANEDEITIFESLGVAVEDLACARLVYDRASERGIGTTVEN